MSRDSIDLNHARELYDHLCKLVLIQGIHANESSDNYIRALRNYSRCITWITLATVTVLVVFASFAVWFFHLGYHEAAVCLTLLQFVLITESWKSLFLAKAAERVEYTRNEHDKLMERYRRLDASAREAGRVLKRALEQRQAKLTDMITRLQQEKP